MECRLLNHRTFVKLFRNLKLLNPNRNIHHQLNHVKTEPPKISTLFVPGRQGSDVYQIVKPFVDVEFLSSNIDAIKRSCQLRGFAQTLDVESLIPLLRRWEALRNEYSEILEKDREYSQEIRNLKSLGQDPKSLQKEHMEFVETLKSAKEKLHDIEDQVLPEIQMIPNVLDPNTPSSGDVVVSQDPTEMLFPVTSHTEVGAKLKNISIPGVSQLTFSKTSPSAYYLLGQLSDLERAIQLYFTDLLQHCNFHTLAPTDFCKSFVYEATGNDPNCSCIKLQFKSGEKERGQKQILVGGASLEALCAYFVNMNVLESTLTKRYISLGRYYDNQYSQSLLKPNLFNVVQSSSIHCISLCKDSTAPSEFDHLFTSILSCYSRFSGIPKRIVDVAAANLNPTESRRRRIELWSPVQNNFVTVAHVSQRGDFVSKRLKMTYGKEHAVEGYCSVVEGRAVNLPVLIGCILENYQTPDGAFEFNGPLEFLHEYVYD